nr:TetR/AcrR family transcriptional regulator [Qipengyuania flava]
MQASWELLLDVGFENFSFDKLARYGRFGKPTIYARFGNKVELLRALLVQSIETRSRDLFDAASRQHIDEAIPSLCADVVEYIHSPEGRLKDRLIDWLDIEAEDGGPSMRGWTGEKAIQSVQQLLRDASKRGEVKLSDIDEVSQFLAAGVIGHGRMTKVEDPFDRVPHITWARSYWVMLKTAFAA